MAQTAAEKLVASARGGSASSKWVPPPIKRGASPFRKVALYGPFNTGKTLALAELLLAGERVFALVTDEGLVTVENWLARKGRPELIENLVHVTARDYETVNSVLVNLDEYYGDVLRELKPTVRAWDGFSVFQKNGVDYEVMPDKLRPRKVTDHQGHETEDSLDPFAYWDKVRRATTRVHDKFLRSDYAGNPGWHTILTCHEDEDKDSKGQGLGKYHAAIAGQSRKSIMAEYDLVIRTRKVESQKFLDGKMATSFEYRYQLEGAVNVEVKNRGWELPADMPADFGKVWGVVTKGETLGGSTASQ